MSLNRLALRLATVTALTNNGQEPFPTMAGRHVYDSRCDPLQLFGERDMQPAMTVFTDRDNFSALDRVDGFANGWRRDADISIEIAVFGMYEEEGVPLIGKPVIDVEVEALLDLFEQQVRNVLAGPSIWAQLWREITGGVAQLSSDRFPPDEQTGLRFAERVLQMTTGLAADCAPPVYVALTNGKYWDGTTEISALPAPALPDSIKALVDAITASGVPNEHVANAVAVLNANGLPGAQSIAALESLRLFDGSVAREDEGVVHIDMPDTD